MKKLTIFFNLIALIGLMFSTQSCETEITPALDTFEPIITIDAWLTSMPGEQTIYINQTAAYFDESGYPTVSGAQVSVVDNIGNTFVFEETESGTYVWGSDTTETSFVQTNKVFQLEIIYDGVVYTASSEARRSPEIDSIVVEKREEELGLPEGYYAQFYARDFSGSGDTYWIKAFKNGQYLNKPSEINIAYDAAFSAGGNFDGSVFISPIREGINPYDEDENEDIISPYTPGDSIRVEVWSVTEDAFYFLADIAELTNREGGIGALFASPIYNTKSNFRVDGEFSEAVTGYFSTSVVNSLETVVEEE